MSQMKKLVLETTAPFQGLPELVAYDEGLFEQEGIAVEWADREKGVEKKVRTDITSPKAVDRKLAKRTCLALLGAVFPREFAGYLAAA